MISAIRPSALTGAGPVYQTGPSAGNDEEAGYQPASPCRAIRSYREVGNGNTLMNRVSTAAMAPSTPTDQRVRLVLEAEIFQDDEGGPDSLIVTTDKLACEPTVPARLLRMVAEARAQLDRMERLVLEYEARDTLRAIVAEHDAQLEEWNTESLDPKLRDKFVAFAMLHKDGTRLIVVPEGQDPIERVNAVADLVNGIQAQA